MKQRQYIALKDSVKSLVLGDLISYEDAVEETGEIPEEIQKQMRDLGLFGLTVSSEYGGLGASLEQVTSITEILGYSSPAYQYLIGSNNGVALYPILYSTNQDLKDEFLSKIASGEIIMAFALSEENAGSDPTSIETVYEKVAGGYRLTGRKSYISNINIANYVIVIALNKNVDKEFSAFLLETSTEGVDIDDVNLKMGHNGSPTASFSLNNVFIPEKNLLSCEGDGIRLAMKSINAARLISSSMTLGLSQRALEESVKYALKRKQFSKPIAEFQLIQNMLSESYIELCATRALINSTAKLADKDIISAKARISACKCMAAETAFPPEAKISAPTFAANSEPAAITPPIRGLLSY